MKSQVKVYARLKPNLETTEAIQYEIEDAGKKKQKLSLASPRVLKYSTALQSLRETLDFTFNRVFEPDANQNDVFEGVAKSVVLNCLDGYNGTIFAYGQTGSGKTYTMSGAESWQLRGIIPRVLSFIFDEVDRRREESEFKVYISYLEIYNEHCYDLLDKDHVDLPLESWHKITMFQGDDGNIHMKNLSMHYCQTEQLGLDLLMMGNYMRKISSTPMNQSSSRSHCIFTIIFEKKNNEDGSVFVSKLHLVDLAGSERISKGLSEGAQMTETKHINLSLSFLEQVIIALKAHQQGKRVHIPYRNSAMTTILKDSLGGNCRTSLITCLSLEQDNFEETVSTCRFGQRCGQLENVIKKNEILDYPTQIKRLKLENDLLQKELEAFRSASEKDRDKRMILESGAEEMTPQGSRHTPSLPQSSPYMQLVSSQEITPEIIKSLKPKIEDYLKEKIEYLDCQNLFEAHVCLEVIKQLYNSKMKEYIKELGVISEKLKSYDNYIAKKIGIDHTADDSDSQARPKKADKK